MNAEGSLCFYTGSPHISASPCEIKAHSKTPREVWSPTAFSSTLATQNLRGGELKRRRRNISEVIKHRQTLGRSRLQIDQERAYIRVEQLYMEIVVKNNDQNQQTVGPTPLLNYLTTTTPIARRVKMTKNINLLKVRIFFQALIYSQIFLDYLRF